MTSVTTPLEEIVSGLREAAEKVTEAVEAHWGERCPDFDADCACCQAWAELDAFQAQAARIAELLNITDSQRFTLDHYEAHSRKLVDRAETAERDLAAAVEERNRLRNKVPARALTDKQLVDEDYAVEARIDKGFGEGGGSPGEWWYERADEIEHEQKRRQLEADLAAHKLKGPAK